MSARVISLNEDLKRLRDEGYEIEYKDAHAIIHHIPYVNVDMKVQYGTLISPLNMRGDVVNYVSHGTAHVIYFQGTHPYCADGRPVSGLLHSNLSGQNVAGMSVNFSFSNKPNGGYHNYYEKFTRYISILQAEAQVIDSTATATTFQRIAEDDNSVFVYADTNSSRATISDISDKLRNQKIGIIGLGGTGSYVLDQISKTPVSEIHLYDGDVFCQHNAFRAPGAAGKDFLEATMKKTEYFQRQYSNMHRNVLSHAVYVTEDNVDELLTYDFVFLCMDTGEHKRIIINKLLENCIPFVDTGIDISDCNRQLLGTARITVGCLGETTTDADRQNVCENISFEDVSDDDLYRSNIQTAELNAFCALMAVFKWKQHCRFYQDLCPQSNRVFNTNDGEFK